MRLEQTASKLYLIRLRKLLVPLQKMIEPARSKIPRRADVIFQPAILPRLTGDIPLHQRTDLA